MDYSRSIHSAPATRTSFSRPAQRITVSTLRQSIIAEVDDSEDEDSQFANVPDDEIPAIEILSASSHRGSPATAHVPSFEWDVQASRKLDQQIKAAHLVANRGELARLATARRIHQRRTQSMYMLPSETPATPPLTPPNAAYASLASPAPFTSAISPLSYMGNFAGLPMMPMTAAPMPRQTQGHLTPGPYTPGAGRARRTMSANYGRPGEANALPSLDEIRVLFEKRAKAKAAKDADEKKKKQDESDEEKKDDEAQPKDEAKKDTDRERRRSGLQVLKRRSLALQTGVDVVGDKEPSPIQASPVQASPIQMSPASAKPTLSPLQTSAPAIKLNDSPVSGSPVKSPATPKRRPVSLQVPPAAAFQGLPGVLRSPEPPKNLLAMRSQASSRDSGRSAAASRMMNRLSLSSRVVTVS